MYAHSMLKASLGQQELRAPAMKDAPAFYRRLEQSLDVFRQNRSLMALKPRWGDDVLDLTTSDFLSLSRTGRIREEFQKELESRGDFKLSASGSRVQYGNYDYLLEVEKEIAEFHNAETAWVCHSGFYANVGVLEAVPLPGDAVVWDELSHASTTLGLKLCLAAHKPSFKHNSVDSLREVLMDLKTKDKNFERGTQNILIAVESIYSMEGDICPLQEMVDVAKELFPHGNAQFIIDEAHSNGVIGPKGAGLVQMLGLEKEIAIRIHMCSKALGSTGGVVLCNQTIRSAITQYSKAMTYSGAPSVPMVASIRAGYRLLANGETEKQQAQIQEIVTYFLRSLSCHPSWEDAMDSGLISVPLAEDYEDRAVHSHVVPIKLRSGYETSLSVHLLMANMNAYPISYPVVPKGTGLVRCVFHAHNTKEEIDRLVNSVAEWADEVMEIENGSEKGRVPSALKRAFAMHANGYQE